MDEVNMLCALTSKRLGAKYTIARIRDVAYTDGGGVDTIVIGGTNYKGTSLRSALGLRSTAFSISTTEDTVTITTRGYGHGVGMSQWGARALAEQGQTASQILAHYFPGTQLRQ